MGVCQKTQKRMSEVSPCAKLLETLEKLTNAVNEESDLLVELLGNFQEELISTMENEQMIIDSLKKSVSERVCPPEIMEEINQVDLRLQRLMMEAQKEYDEFEEKFKSEELRESVTNAVPIMKQLIELTKVR